MFGVREESHSEGDPCRKPPVYHPLRGGHWFCGVPGVSPRMRGTRPLAKNSSPRPGAYENHICGSGTLVLPNYSTTILSVCPTA